MESILSFPASRCDAMLSIATGREPIRRRGAPSPNGCPSRATASLCSPWLAGHDRSCESYFNESLHSACAKGKAFLYNRRQRSVIHVQMAATLVAATAELDAHRGRDHLCRAWHPETAELSGPGARRAGNLSFALYGDSRNLRRHPSDARASDAAGRLSALR